MISVHIKQQKIFRVTLDGGGATHGAFLHADSNFVVIATRSVAVEFDD